LMNSQMKPQWTFPWMRHSDGGETEAIKWRPFDGKA
jgi:hypothetical protein